MTLGKALTDFNAAHPGLLDTMGEQVAALLRPVPNPTDEQHAAATVFTMGALYFRYVDDDETQAALLTGFYELLHRSGEGQGDA